MKSTILRNIILINSFIMVSFTTFGQEPFEPQIGKFFETIKEEMYAKDLREFKTKDGRNCFMYRTSAGFCISCFWSEDFKQVIYTILVPKNKAIIQFHVNLYNNIYHRINKYNWKYLHRVLDNEIKIKMEKNKDYGWVFIYTLKPKEYKN